MGSSAYSTSKNIRYLVTTYLQTIDSISQDFTDFMDKNVW